MDALGFVEYKKSQLISFLVQFRSIWVPGQTSVEFLATELLAVNASLNWSLNSVSSAAGVT